MDKKSFATFYSLRLQNKTAQGTEFYFGIQLRKVFAFMQRVGLASEEASSDECDVRMRLRTKEKPLRRYNFIPDHSAGSSTEKKTECSLYTQTRHAVCN